MEIERQFRTFPLTIPNFLSHVGVMAEKEFYAYPLGEVNISVNDKSTVDVNSSNFKIFDFFIDKTDAHFNHSQLVNNLMTFVRSLEG